MRFLVTIYFWTVFLFITLFLSAWSMIRIVKMRFLGKEDSRPIHDLAAIWGRCAFAMTPGWDISVEGAEFLPTSNVPMVIVANHESMSDIWAMYYLGLQFRWLSKAEIFSYPIIGRVMKAAKYVPVARGDSSSHEQAMQLSADRLSEGLSMFFFPEGTRSRDGKIKVFKSGAFRLARDCHVPVLPIAIHGAGNLLPKGSLIPRPTHVKVRVLPPVPPPGPDDDMNAYAQRIRELIVDAHKTLLG